MDEGKSDGFIEFEIGPLLMQVMGNGGYLALGVFVGPGIFNDRKILIGIDLFFFGLRFTL